MELRTKDRAAGVLSAKVQGTWLLDHLLEGEPLDFFVLCSSMNAVIGGAGEADYSAANAFLDAFAAQKNACGSSARVLSVNWGAWQEVGMAVETEVPAPLRKWKEENLRNGIRSAEGIEAFKRILANPAPQTVVSPVDLPAVLERIWNTDGQAGAGVETRPADTGLEQPAAFSGAEGSRTAAQSAAVPAAQAGPDARPEIQSAYAAPTTDIEKKMVDIWQDLIGVAPIGIQDNFFELGGHSLMATQILSRIRDTYKIELPLRVFFETNTIAELSKRIDALLWVERNQQFAGQSFADEASTDREEITL